jgi:hypothetical protein
VRLAADPRFDRTEQARLAARRIEDRIEHERGRRLPVRPRDTRDLELVSRAAEEDGGGLGHRQPRVGDHELRHARRDGMLDDERRGACVDRPPGQLVPVEALASHAEEERPRPHRARVVREIRYLDAEIPDNLARGEGFGNVLELHWGRGEPSNERRRC